MWPCIVTNIFVIKPTRCTNFTNLFWHETLHVSDSSSVHHQEFIHRNTQQWYGTVFLPGPARKLSTNPYDVYHCWVLRWINSWWWTDELSETCTVSCQNKFVKLVHLVGFITKKFSACHSYTAPVHSICNSWWWTDELYRVSWQNKFVKLVHLVGFITYKFVHIVEIVWHRRVPWSRLLQTCGVCPWNMQYDVPCRMALYILE
jgi:hypothetical protein